MFLHGLSLLKYFLNHQTSSPLLVLSGYSLYVNFDLDNYTPVISHIHVVGILVLEKLQANQLFFQSFDFED